MLRDEENHVALFIDWDNLAISTAADLGGAAPDVRAIVRVAQRYGTILQARAYAEWQVPSDRMAVYRAGVDPIYAPTFRFEPDPIGQAPRGKSLADPCLVADCIDTLHLLPSVNHFVLVSGDKDLIPIVRLVQLRGKRVVVVGPDYVAAILREMADEYVSYRGLVESGEATAIPEVSQPGRRGRRPTPSVRASVSAAPAAPAPSLAPAVAPPVPHAGRPSRQPAPTPPPPPLQRPPVAEPPSPPPSRPVPLEQPPLVEAEEVGVNGEVERAEVPEVRERSPEDLKGLFATIEQILHEREAQGKPRLRATNLKDLLMARISGFSERDYGFSKLRDLLSAAEKAGILEVTRSGPVQWVTLPRHREERQHGEVSAPPAPAPSPAPIATPAPAPIPARAAPAVEPSVEAPAQPLEAQPLDERSADVIRFIADLGQRSRWLTFTYVLTNLITHLTSQLPLAEAEAEARNVLNRLVQANVLRVDREPREIEVGGARHRVRLCHLEETHPAVIAALAGGSDAESVGEVTSLAPEREGSLQPSPTAEPAHPEPASAPATEAYGLAPLPDALLAPSEPSGPASPVGAPAPQPLAEQPVATVATAAAAEPAATPEALEASGEATEAPAAPTLEQAFAALREVVRQATGPGKPMAGAASVKTRLGRSLGGFDERTYGFGKFKDFLLAAQRGGYVRVESVGPATRVALPAEA